MRRALLPAVITAVLTLVTPAHLPSAVASGPSAPTSAASRDTVATGTAGTYAALPPARVLDTRTGLGARRSRVTQHGTVDLGVLGVAGVPDSGVVAVVLTITAVRPETAGYITVYPAGGKRPPTSNLNVVTGETTAVLAVARVGSGGHVTLYNGTSGGIDLVADISGYYRDGDPSAPGVFVPTTPARVLDTRRGNGAPLGAVAAHKAVTVQVEGRGGVPSSGVAAVVLGVTGIRPDKAGYVTAYPAGTSRPTTSTLNVPAGGTVANLAVVPLDDQGRVAIYNGSAGTINLVADVFGYVLAGEASATGAFVPVSPTRILDSRVGLGTVAGQVPGHATVDVQATGRGGVPTTPVSAVVINLTATGATGPGYVTAFSGERPVVSNLNDGPGRTVANLAVVPVDRLTGRFRLFNGSSAGVHLIADVEGYVLAPSPVDLTWTDEGIVHHEGGANLASISCPSADFCVAVGAKQAILWHGGPSWTEPERLLPDTRWDALMSVSCASSELCVVGSTEGRVFLYDGHGWSTPYQVDPSGTDVEAVACAPGGVCQVATADGAVRTYDGVSWSAPTTVEPDGHLWSMSCPSATFCAAADSRGRTLTFDGTSWTDPVDQSPLGPIWSISCPSPTFCGALAGTMLVTSGDGVTWTATTIQGLGGHDPAGLACYGERTCLAFTPEYSTVVKYDGAQWSTIEALSDPIGGSQPLALGCDPSGFCVVGTLYGSLGILTGDSWSQVVPWDGLRTTLDVSCPTSDHCVGVDFSGFTFAYDHGRWQPQQYVGSSLGTLSCPTDTFCLATGYGSRSYLYDGTTWTQIPGVPTDFAVDCAGPDFCAAVDQSGRPQVFDGTSWQLAIGSYPSDANHVSCPSATFCAVSFDAGEVAVFRNGTWHAAEALTDGTRLDDVDCPSDRFCVATDDLGRAYTYDGTTWNTNPTQVDPSGKSIYTVSCPSEDFCVASGLSGSWVYTWNAWAPSSAPGTVGTVSCPDPSMCLLIGYDGHAFIGRP